MYLTTLHGLNKHDTGFSSAGERRSGAKGPKVSKLSLHITYSAQPCAAEVAPGELPGDPFVRPFGCLGGGVAASAGGYGGVKGGKQLDAAL